MTTVRTRHAVALAATLGLACASNHSAGPLPPDSTQAVGFLDTLEQRTFHYFWDLTNTANGLTLDRSPTPSFSSIAAVGFALTAYPIGVERGYITRAQAVERVAATARFFRNAPQGPQSSGTAGHKGFFYHFLDMRTGTRYRDVELSTIDTALLMGGMLFCRSYFDRDSPDEAEIRRLVDEIYARIEWTWMQVRGAAISHGWLPESG